MADDNARPELLVTAVADGAPVDWRAAAAAGSPADADLLRQLQVIAAIRSALPVEAVTRRSAVRGVLVAACVAGISLATIKVVLALVAAPAVLAGAGTGAGWNFALNLAIFGGGGLILLAGGVRDRRLQLLGGLYVTMASAFAPAFLGPPDSASAVARAVSACPTEAFFALNVWLFAWSFPGEPAAGRTRRLFGAAVLTAFATTLVLFSANVALRQTLWPVETPWLVSLLHGLNRRAPTSMFWPLLFGVTLPAIPCLLVKARAASPATRRRVLVFLSGWALGLLPILVAAIAAPFVPALADPVVRQRVGVVVYAALAAVVPITAYAVAVDHVMELQFVVRATLQYALARSAVWAVVAAPISYLALDVFAHRDLTILEYLARQRPLGVFVWSGLGLLALTFRPALRRQVDSWFDRAPLDASQAMAHAAQAFRGATHTRAVAEVLADELCDALHARRVAVLLQSDDSRALVASDGATPPLPAESVLLEVLRGTRTELRFEGPADRLARLLPAPDQDWLDHADARIVSPLIGATGGLLGVVAIGAPRQDLPYTAAHLQLVTALSGQAAMLIENRSLRETRLAGGAEAPTGRVDWQHEPAAWCPTCSETWSADTRRCRCGTPTRTAVLPLFVNGKFRLQRLLGSGGTGVVYLAMDMALNRRVALKTLPSMRPHAAERLRREARAMAAVLHPNLATIHGAEEWRGTPFLVVEYLDGGTLLDWLRRGPRPADEVIELGIILADVLDRVHGSGVLHRDIKPSNIGYTADGVPKLLDFGLAAMLDRSQGENGGDAAPAAVAIQDARLCGVTASSTLTVTDHIVGTPLYLSPEALAGAPPREAVDLWSLGLVLYEAVAGRHPFGGGTGAEVVDAIRRQPVPGVRAFCPDCPAGLAAFLDEALSADVARRPATAAAFRTGLRALQIRSTPSRG